MASGLSMPVGYKNGTDGTATIAINAMQAASKPHHFLGINNDGHASIVSTTGNPDGHLVLRGGKNGTNYHLDAINLIADELAQFKMPGKSWLIVVMATQIRIFVDKQKFYGMLHHS